MKIIDNINSLLGDDLKDSINPKSKLKIAIETTEDIKNLELTQIEGSITQIDPEKINDSPQSAPSKRLQAETSYIKAVHGPNIAKEIGLDVLREQCAGFNGWLDKLEVLPA